jgi:hypothetical protein
MAKLEGNIQFTGTLGELSAYRIKQTGVIVLRRKGGASKEKIRNAPEFINTRKNNREFGSCARAATAIRRTLHPLRQIPDHNLQPSLSALCRKILVQDASHEWGKREICFSRHPHLLEGYNLSRRDSFDSVLTSPLTCIADPALAAVALSVAALLPDANLRLPGAFSYYRLVFSLGLLPDHPYELPGYLPTDARYGEWTRTGVGQPAQVHQLQLPGNMPVAAGYSLLIAAGIEMSVNGQEAVRHAGCGKILGLVAG